MKNELQQEIEFLRSQVEILRITCDAHISVIEDTERESNEWKRRAIEMQEFMDECIPEDGQPNDYRVRYSAWGMFVSKHCLGIPVQDRDDPTNWF